MSAWALWARRVGKGAFYLAVAWLLVGFVVAPLISTALQSLGGQGLAGLSGYADFFSRPGYRTAVLNTLAVGGLSVLSCGAVGTVLALYVSYFCRRWVRAVQVLLMAPVMIPGVVIVVAFVQLYGDAGILSRFVGSLVGVTVPSFSGLFGIVVVITFTQYVYFYLNMVTALRLIDGNLVDSVRSFGGGRWAVFASAIWPAIRPAVLLSALTTFVSAAGSYSAPALIGGSFRVLSTQIVAAKVSYDMVLASIEVVVLLAIGVLATASVTLLRRHYAQAVSVRSVPWRPRMAASSWGARIFRVVAWLQIAGVVLPVAAIVYLSFMTTQSIMMESFPTGFTVGNYEAVFTNARTFKPLANSFTMALQSTLAVLVLVIPVVLAARRAGARVPAALEAVMALPWCMPASVIAIGLINEFGAPSIFSGGVPLVGTFEILPIAYAVSALPLMLNSTQVAVGGVSDAVEEASRSLGAGPVRTFSAIVLPALAPGVLSGAILCFVRTVGEYTMSALLYGVSNRPISVSIVTTMQEYAVGTSMAYGTLVIVLCSVLLVGLLKLDRSQLGIVKEELQ